MKNKLIIVAVAGAIGLSSGFAQSSPSKSKDKQEPSGSKTVAFGGIEKGIPITKEEAMKKYPPRGKGYPTPDIMTGPDSTVSTTEVASPYPPHHRFDVSAINHGDLVLDPYAKHVFVRP